ncbi:MAG TPA: hypothetical protein VN673_01650, partial [Clostridia bacterium]|nr:hypothetical protein [Clostridia bacterium]
LRNQPETGAVLSRVSQILRRYVSHAFQLSAGEQTTTDLVRAMRTQAGIGPRLAGTIGEFLKACDERKFAPPSGAPPLNAAVEAERLVESVEARRAELRAAAQSNPPPVKPA